MSKSVKAALIANGIIATAKGIVTFFTGSASMMVEAIHSTADCGNQALVLVGQRQAARGRSESYSFGQGKANFFWPFVVLLSYFLNFAHKTQLFLRINTLSRNPIFSH